MDRLGVPIERVLVADDDLEMVRLLQRMLAARPSVIQCLEAYNGREVLEVLARDKPDLILLDLVMPEMDGHAVLRALRSDDALATIPVIVISGDPEESATLDPLGSVRLSKEGGLDLAGVMAHLKAALSAATPGRPGLSRDEPGPPEGLAATPAWGDTWSPPTPAPDRAD
jgi:CheY-like chemotaxis protein